MEKYDLLKWKEFGTPDAPSIKILFCPKGYPYQEKIAEYLEKGKVNLVSPAYSVDAITGEIIRPAKTDCTKSNGLFSWDGSLPYYIRKYNLRLPSEYEDYILNELQLS